MIWRLFSASSRISGGGKEAAPIGSPSGSSVGVHSISKPGGKSMDSIGGAGAAVLLLVLRLEGRSGFSGGGGSGEGSFGGSCSDEGSPGDDNEDDDDTSRVPVF